VHLEIILYQKKYSKYSIYARKNCLCTAGTVFSKKNLIYRRGALFFKKKSFSVPQVWAMLEYSKYSKSSKNTNAVLTVLFFDTV
jgi:hypothetical protein